MVQEISHLSVPFGTTVIECAVSYADRRTLAIVVNPDQSVLVKAPIAASEEQIAAKIHKRAAWILRQQRFFASFGEQMPPRRYISGESHWYMGRQYLLRVTRSDHNAVLYQGRTIEIMHRPQSSPKKMMQEWYRSRANAKYAELMTPIAARFARYGVQPTGIAIQEMTTRWGSCTRQGKIILNLELIKAPRPCIEYVITHELCHLVHANHTLAFYRLLEQEMPDWKRWKRKLDTCLFGN